MQGERKIRSKSWQSKEPRDGGSTPSANDCPSFIDWTTETPLNDSLTQSHEKQAQQALP